MAMKHAQSWVNDGKVRFVAASTHSHKVGAKLAEAPELDALMLRYSMSHKEAAEAWSFPAAQKFKKPVLAFTTTRWNRLQNGHPDWKPKDDDDENLAMAPSTADCLDFALGASPSVVEVVLHSARDQAELYEAMDGLKGKLSPKDNAMWRRFGSLDWNDDSFDEYPEERIRHL